MKEEYLENTEDKMAETKKVALIIDDSRVNQNILLNLLDEKGYDTVSAYNGLDGLEQFKSLKPSLTFLDIVMPKMSGLEVLKHAHSMLTF